VITKPAMSVESMFSCELCDRR